jgi:hypothetical protein
LSPRTSFGQVAQIQFRYGDIGNGYGGVRAIAARGLLVKQAGKDQCAPAPPMRPAEIARGMSSSHRSIAKAIKLDRAFGLCAGEFFWLHYRKFRLTCFRFEPPELSCTGNAVA